MDDRCAIRRFRALADGRQHDLVGRFQPHPEEPGKGEIDPRTAQRVDPIHRLGTEVAVAQRARLRQAGVVGRARPEHHVRGEAESVGRERPEQQVEVRHEHVVLVVAGPLERALRPQGVQPQAEAAGAKPALRLEPDDPPRLEDRGIRGLRIGWREVAVDGPTARETQGPGMRLGVRRRCSQERGYGHADACVRERVTDSTCAWIHIVVLTLRYRLRGCSKSIVWPDASRLTPRTRARDNLRTC